MTVIRRLAALCLSVGLCIAIAACTVNPATGRTQFDALNPEQEVAMGREAAPQLIEQFGGAVPDGSVQAYVTQVGQSMVPHTEGEYPSLPWEFTVLNSDVINAFALPGGFVFVSRGMAEAMSNEAQLAAVLGHEMGHVTARHVNDRFGQQLGVGIIGAGIGAIFGGGQGAAAAAGIATDVGGQLVLLSFSRDQELEADELGMRYMSRAGYDPRGMRQMMEVLQRESGRRGGLEFFSTHPNPDTRIQRIDSELQREYAGVQGRQDPQSYQQRMLAPLSRIPAAQRRSGVVPGGAAGALAFNFADPTTWCAHCAAEAAGRAN